MRPCHRFSLALSTPLSSCTPVDDDSEDDHDDDDASAAAGDASNGGDHLYLPSLRLFLLRLPPFTFSLFLLSLSLFSLRSLGLSRLASASPCVRKVRSDALRLVRRDAFHSGVLLRRAPTRRCKGRVQPYARRAAGRHYKAVAATAAAAQASASPYPPRPSAYTSANPYRERLSATAAIVAAAAYGCPARAHACRFGGGVAATGIPLGGEEVGCYRSRWMGGTGGDTGRITWPPRCR